MSAPFASGDPLSPARATRWRLRSRWLDLPRRPLVMGIVNATPDSFSDGGRYFAQQQAIEHGLALAAEGADLLDVGGESTRPYSQPVPPDEEARRVVDVVRALAERAGVPISIDTSKAAVAREALAAGAEIINDVTALAGDPDMLGLAATSAAGVCLMHMRGTPQTMQDDPRYDDLIGEIAAFLAGRRDACIRVGIPLERIALDPGVGFGKTHGHNVQIVANCYRLHELGCPLLVGHSRKGFLAKVMGDKQADLTAGTIGASIALALQGVQIVRVHDVRAVRHALAVFEAVGGLTGQPVQLP
ncbi:MAG TPA: dihydropteroate synthase [Pirellulales bacterium]|jgi:dihydropteroate synthase|nr:dihydropteroate synthase [Pirellulales bacterium]